MQFAQFLLALDFSSLLAALTGHRLLQRMHCGDHSIYLDLLIKHFLTGMCTALKGPLCKSTVQGCHRVHVRPLVSMMTCVYRSGILDHVPSTNLLPFWCFLAWGSPEHKHDCTIDMLKWHAADMQYFPYKGDITYLNMVFDEHFDKLSRKELAPILDVHGLLDGLTCSWSVADMWDLLCQHLFGGQCAEAFQTPLLQIPVGCLENLNEHTFNDCAMSKTFTR